MSNQIKSTIVTIADRRYFMPVFILILSLKFHKVKAYIKVLGVDLREDEKEFISQFDNVEVYDADPSNKRGAFSRKAEAILLAAKDDVQTISLLDGDCIVTGDISPYLTKDVEGFSTRHKSMKEDGEIFAARNCYQDDDIYGTIPKSILVIWQNDVCERDHSRLTNTIASGNLTVCKKDLDFIKCWDSQIMKILPNEPGKIAHNFLSFAYFQTDEHVLNSLLAFKNNVPKLSPGWFDQDPDAFVAHLGPSCFPRYWFFWIYGRLQYYRPVMELLEWGRVNYNLPKLTWALKKRNKLIVFICAYLYEVVISSKKIIKFFISHIVKSTGNSKKS